MPIDLANYDAKAKDAVKLFWGNRSAAVEKQKQSGKVDQGERASVTSGKNMDGFLTLAQDIVQANGLWTADIKIKGSVLTLPGYFRPTKLWDMLVIDGGHLIAALEFKSQVGPSFGNNFNNRTEEAIGTAHDLWTAYREGALGKRAPKPFVGWLMLVEDTEKSRTPVKNVSPNFEVFPEFDGASYVDRYDILCRRLVQERLYSATAVVLADRGNEITGEYSEVDASTNLKSFVTSFAGHIAAAAANK